MDLAMPGLDGRDAIIRLKLDVRTRAIPVLACSGIDRAKAEAQAKEAGCEAFVAKPVHPDVLCELLDKLTTVRPMQSRVRSRLSGIAEACRPTLSGLLVLVADDEAEVRHVLTTVLRSHGARCVEAGTGHEAFEQFVAHRPEIVVSDMWMPDGDGFELIRRIRDLAPERGGLTPAVGFSGEANAEQLLMAGYQVLLPKPIDLHVLIDTLAEFLHGGREPVGGTSWDISCPAPGRLEMTFAGYVSAADARAAMADLLQHLEEGPCRVHVDLRKVTGFSVAGASLAQVAVWPKRHAIVHVTVAGGPLSARIVASASCHLLGIGCTMEGPREG
jgi:CheY-like chemotaxis protein